MRRLFRFIFAFISMLALAFAAAAIFISYKVTLNYLHPKRHYASAEQLTVNNIPFQEVELTAQDSVNLSAWYTPPQNGTVILVAHGYGASRSASFYKLFADYGYGVLAWDFRAHGNSGGDFSSLGYYEVLDVKAALDYALAQPGVEHVGGWGGSMGGVTMIRAAAQYPEIEAVVADSAFSTLEDLLNVRMPFVIRPSVRFFAEWNTGVSFDKVRAVDDAARISPRPLFVIQGMSDTMAPIDSAQRIYDAAGEPKLLWTEPDPTHLAMYSYYREEYAKRVIGFFDEYLLGK